MTWEGPIQLLSRCRAGIAPGLIVILLGLAPLAVAQDVHHELAAADTDGHEHSDSDLCQWVQHHTAGSLGVEAPVLTALELVWDQPFLVESVLPSATLAFIGPSRAPPRS